MDCEQTKWISDKEFFRQFNRKIIKNRVPVQGSLNLTHNCNLRCVHCYLSGYTEKANQPARELSTDQWISLIDEITEAGCLLLLITGGEPLLRKDFTRIYSYAKERGLLVAVFTNGTLITEDILQLFRELPPRMVEVSIYGATARTYESITGVKGSFDKCISGIRQLKENNINVKLKTMLITLNQHEFTDIKNFAKDLDLGFRFDAAIFPRFSGDRSPISLRVSPEEAVRIESSESEYGHKLKSFYEKHRGAPSDDTLYQCGAGRSTFNVDSFGNLKPCLMTTKYSYSLLQGSFKEGWNHAMPRIRQRKAGRSYSCNTCHKRVLCGYCPAFFDLENHSENLRSEYLCATGNLRFQLISDKILERKENECEAPEEGSLAKI